ncbi:MAG: cation diffusion facilitator family transporter [Thermoanaerobaculia bacterium]|nr:cation diffusion facilitator family transporter [Thermoanaerobaculia bacterium]
MSHRHPQREVGNNKKRLAFVLALTSTYLICEVVGGYLTGSLALLADAGHMLTDVAGLGLALLAIRIAARPATPERTYGYHRVEILAALANAVALLGISIFVLFEAWGRFRNPPVVESRGMLLVAVVGLIVNIIGVLILRKGSGENLNVRGAYFEVLSDMLASVGVMLAGCIMWATGWYYADPIVSALIGLLIIPRTWVLLREAVGILLEGTPSDVDLGAVRSALADLPGVVEIHDLHVWTLTSGMNAMSAHVTVGDGEDLGELLNAIQDAITTRFPIGHVTVQLEHAGARNCEAHA